LHRGLSVGRFDLFDSRRLAHTQNFIIVSLLCSTHIQFVRFPFCLICHYIRCALRVYRYAHHCWPQNTTVKYIAWLKHFENRTVLILGRFRTIQSLMQVRIEKLADRINALGPQFRQVVQQLLVNQLEAFSVTLVLSLLVCRKGLLKSIQHWNQLLDHSTGRPFLILAAFFLDSLTIIIKIGLPPQLRLPHVFELVGQFVHFYVLACRIIDHSICAVVLLRIRVIRHVHVNLELFFFHKTHSLASALLHFFQSFAEHF